jgi:hypothetical protein
MSYILVDEGWLHELCDDEHALEEEFVPYKLIHALIDDVQRLQQMIIETREEVNRLSPNGVVYDLTAENVFNGTYHEFPAMKRYAELYEGEAIRIWENW